MIPEGIAAGALAGSVLLFFSHVAPAFGAGNFIRDLDQPRLFSRTITRREAHVIGALVLLFVSAASGGLYAWLVSSGIVSGFDYLPLLGWSVVMTLFFGGVILPLEGHGLFGVREDAWFPVDLILTNAGWCLAYGWIVRLFIGGGR